MIYSDNKQYDKALEYLKESLKIIEDQFGDHHEFTTIAYQNIGVIHYKKRLFDDALKYFLKSLASSKRSFGEYSNQTARCNENIMMTYLKMNMIGEASKYFEESMQIRSKGRRKLNINFSQICYLM